MDLWSRLIAGKSKPLSENERRLLQFKREWQNIQAWNKLTITKPSTSTVVSIRTCANRLLVALRDDARTQARDTLSYALSARVYAGLARLASRVNDARFLREVLSFFSFFLNVEDELIASEAFAQALIVLIGIIDDAKGGASHELQTAVLQLTFDIAAKLRVQPEALPAWFTEEEEALDEASAANTVTETVFEAPAERTNFPLCHHFLKHVYQEGRVGDFARTGLLYMFDSATRSSQLETWIVQSDISRLLASGLGALYSQLSRKLTIMHPREDLPLILALSEEGSLPDESDIESFYSPETQSRLSTFTSYITFWRDMIDRCRSLSIKDTLVDNFHVFFLQQILYPSILESSDVDGGSAVAVLSYCWSLLESLQQEDLVHHMLHYLLALPGPASSRPMTPALSQVLNKGQPDITSRLAKRSVDTLNPSFFSLVDLILATLGSDSAEAVTSALRLVSILLRQHHHYATGSLVRVLPAKEASAKRTLGILRQETTGLLQLATELGGDAGMDETYDNSLKDALAMIESHDCSREHPSLKMLNGHQEEDEDTPPRVPRPSMYKHRLRMDDPLMLALISLLDQFFVNEIEVNLALTEVLAHLASCPYVKLEGWLAVEPSVYQTLKDAQKLRPTSFDGSELYIGDDEEELEQQRIKAYKKASRILDAQPKHQPSLVMILHKLKDDLNAATADIEDFEQLIASRKRAFEGAAEMEDDMAQAPPSFARRGILSSGARSPRSPAISSNTPAADVTPRGRGIAEMMGLPPLYDMIAGKSKPGRSPSGTLRSKASQSTIGQRSASVSTKAVSPRVSRNLRGSIAEEPPLSPLRSPAIPVDTSFNVFERSITFSLDGEGCLTPSSLRGDIDPFEGREEEEDEDAPKATLSRVLTNVIILQEFILELAAIMQVRAGLFDGDVSFG